jgi:hypothetical protein
MTHGFLDCYDGQDHNDYVTLDGATNTDWDKHRIIRSSPSCATPFNGRAGSGAHFHPSGSMTSVFKLGDQSYGCIFGLDISLTSSSASTISAIVLQCTGADAIKNVIHHVEDSAHNNCNGVECYSASGAKSFVVYRNIIYSCEGNGILVNSLTAGYISITCNTCINNGGSGITLASNTNPTNMVFSNYGADNGNDFLDASANYDAPSGYNASKDNTSDLGGFTANYTNGLNLIPNMDSDYQLNSAAQYGRNPNNDVTALESWNYGMYESWNAWTGAGCEYDISGSRTVPYSTIDATIDVGASQFVAVAPTVTTSSPSATGPTTGSGGGNVTSDGGDPVTARGVCWSISANPTTANSHTTDGSGTGVFASSLTGLSPATTYHVRAYATNAVGTSYGSDETFSTQPARGRRRRASIKTVITNSIIKKKKKGGGKKMQDLTQLHTTVTIAQSAQVSGSFSIPEWALFAGALIPAIDNGVVTLQVSMDGGANYNTVCDPSTGAAWTLLASGSDPGFVEFSDFIRPLMGCFAGGSQSGNILFRFYVATAQTTAAVTIHLYFRG